MQSADTPDEVLHPDLVAADNDHHNHHNNNEQARQGSPQGSTPTSVPGVTPSTALPDTSKLAIRRERNRQSAARSRENRAKQHQEAVDRLEEAQREIEALRSENEELRTKLQVAEARLRQMEQSEWYQKNQDQFDQVLDALQKDDVQVDAAGAQQRTRGGGGAPLAGILNGSAKTET